MSEQAIDELKRAEHLIDVTLKYTRTVDVMKSIIKKLIEIYNIAIEDALKYAKQQGKIEKIPGSPKGNARVLINLLNRDALIMEDISFYFLLKNLDKGYYDKSQEFRKNVTFLVPLNEKDKKIVDKLLENYKKEKEEKGDEYKGGTNIDVLKIYYKKTSDFVRFIKNYMEGNEREAVKDEYD